MSGYADGIGKVFAAGMLVGAMLLALAALLFAPEEKTKQHTCYEVQMMTVAPDGTQVGAAAVVCYKELTQQGEHIGTEVDPSVYDPHRGVR